jgi:flagellar M-ring protein FliF
VIPSPAIEAPVYDESRDERQREIEQMVEEQPEEVASLLRGWLAATR